jgi:hypothetical protein
MRSAILRLNLLLAFCAVCSQASAQSRCPEGASAEAVRRGLAEAVRSDVADAARAAGIAEPRGLLLVMMDREGRRPVLRLFGGELPESVTVGVMPRVRELIAEERGRRRDRVRLMVRLEEPDTACADRSPISAAALQPEEARSRLLRLIEYGRTRRPGVNQVLIWLAVDRQGQVVYSEVERADGEIVPHERISYLTQGSWTSVASREGVPVDSFIRIETELCTPGEGSLAAVRCPARRPAITVTHEQ